MSEFAEAKPHPIMGARDVAAQYVGLQTRVDGIDKTVENLARFVRDDSGQIRRDMAEQNAAIRHEMAAQNNTVIASIEKLTLAAGSGNASIRAEFAAEIGKLAEKQGLKSGTLIGVGMLMLGALGFFVTQNNRPMESAILRLETLVERHSDRLDAQSKDYVPRSEIERSRVIRDRLDDRVTLKIDRLDERLRAVEMKTAK